MIHLIRLSLGFGIIVCVMALAVGVALVLVVAKTIYEANPVVVKGVGLVLLLLFMAYWLGRIYEYNYPDDFNRVWHRKVASPPSSDD